MMFGHLSKLVNLIGASESQLHMYEFTSTFCVLAISPNDALFVLMSTFTYLFHLFVLLLGVSHCGKREDEVKAKPCSNEAHSTIVINQHTICCRQQV